TKSARFEQNDFFSGPACRDRISSRNIVGETSKCHKKTYDRIITTRCTLASSGMNLLRRRKRRVRASDTIEVSRFLYECFRFRDVDDGELCACAKAPRP